MPNALGTNVIGPTFPAELVAAGLTGLAIAWTPTGGFSYGSAVTDAQKTAVAAVFAAHDPTKQDPRQQYDAAIASGVAVTSAATPALDATYAIDDETQGKMEGITAGINSGKGLPGGGSTFNYPDATGAMHAFAAPAFLNLAKAIEDYIYALVQTEAALIGGHTASWPSAAIAIP